MKPREWWIDDEGGYIYVIKQSAYVDLKAQCEKLAEALQDSNDLCDVRQIYEQGKAVLADYNKFKESLT